MFKAYYENGQLQKEGIYQEGRHNSRWQWWYEDGLLKRECNYKNGREIDTCRLYDSLSNLQLLECTKRVKFKRVGENLLMVLN